MQTTAPPAASSRPPTPLTRQQFRMCFEKQLWSELGFGEPIRVFRCRNEEMECERRPPQTSRYPAPKHKRDWKDFAILYRGNAPVAPAGYSSCNISPESLITCRGGTMFFRPPEVKDLHAPLRLLWVQSRRMTKSAACA